MIVIPHQRDGHEPLCRQNIHLHTERNLLRFRCTDCGAHLNRRGKRIG